MRPNMTHYIALLLSLLFCSIGTFAEDNNRGDKISGFDLASNPSVARSASAAETSPPLRLTPVCTSRRSVGSALSPAAGIGVGVSVDLTYDDAQYTHGQGRYIASWWNGEYGPTGDVSLHFGYRDWPDSTPGVANPMSGYNVFDPTVAPDGTWPRTQGLGCDLQMSDTVGWGGMPSLDIMHNGRVVMAAESHLGNGFLGDGSAFVDNMMFYQVGEFNCAYAPDLHTTFIDSAIYRPQFIDNSEGNYSRFPQVATQWDGANSIVHALLLEETGEMLSGDHYVSGDTCFAAVHFRRVGETADAGSWSAGTIIDSLWFPWASMTAAPYPTTGLAISYTNPSYYGALLNNAEDLDVWCRESFDRGLSWQNSYSITNYINAIPGEPTHFTAWLESACMFDSDGDLHVVWTARRTSADPYFDGFNWHHIYANIYHWEKDNGQVTPGTGDIVKIANGEFMEGDDLLCGSINTLHCGFGGSNAGYIANVNIAQCDDKLYCIWNQIHERANRFP